MRIKIWSDLFYFTVSDILIVISPASWHPLRAFTIPLIAFTSILEINCLKLMFFPLTINKELRAWVAHAILLQYKAGISAATS